METQAPAYINITPENLAQEPLCCIVRSRKPHPGVEAKRQWLAERLPEGHVFRKLNAKGTAFIEYAPLETAWVPVVGANYLYLYCLWVTSEHKGKGHARALLEYCLADARAQGRSGVCMLGAVKQKAWLPDQAFAKKFGFTAVDSTANGYELLALSWDGAVPRFAPSAKQMAVEAKGLAVYYSMQCPYVLQSVEQLAQYCEAGDVPLTRLPVDSLQKAKALPCVFNNWGLFYEGRFITVNVLSDIDRLVKAGG